MKKNFILFIVFLFLTLSFSFGQSAYANLYTNIYEAAESWTGRFSAVKDFYKVEPNSPECLQFMKKVANDYLEDAKAIANPGEKAAWDNCAEIVVKFLSVKGSAEDAETFWKIYQVTKNSTIRGLILEGMGKLNSPNACNRIKLLLDSINKGNYSERLNSEEIAQGAILGLQALNDSSAYSVLFFASNSWYSGSTKRMAKKALESLIVANGSTIATEMVNMIAEPELSLNHVLTILQEATRLSFSSAELSQVALAALNHAQTVNDFVLNSQAKRSVIFLALDNLDDSLDNLPALKNCLKESRPQDEKIHAIRAFGKYKSDEAFAIIKKLVDDFNDRAELGMFNPSDEEIVLYEIIDTLEKMNSPKGMAILASIISVSNYSNGLKQRAKNSMLPKKN